MLEPSAPVSRSPSNEPQPVSAVYGWDYLPLFCPNSDCPMHPLPDPKDGPRTRFYSRDGSYHTQAHPEGIQRFGCHSCKQTFSRTCFDLEFGEKRMSPGLNEEI